MIPFKMMDNSLKINIKLTPNASKDFFQSWLIINKESCSLKVSVTAIPENNKANIALIKFLSKTWKIPKSSIQLISGHTHRNKTILISDCNCDKIKAIIKFINDMKP